MEPATLKPALVPGVKMFDEFRRADSHASKNEIGPVKLKSKLIDGKSIESLCDANQIPAVVGAVKITVGSVHNPVSTMCQKCHRVAIVDSSYSCRGIMASGDEVFVVRCERKCLDGVSMSFENMDKLVRWPVPNGHGVTGGRGQPSP